MGALDLAHCIMQGVSDNGGSTGAIKRWHESEHRRQ
jgi:hypothetical protein